MVQLGDIVLYALTERDATEINRRRQHAADNLPAMRHEKRGFQAHVGSPVDVGELVPMIITLVWPEDGVVNGQALLDGSDALWIHRACRGGEPGQWHPKFR